MPAQSALLAWSAGCVEPWTPREQSPDAAALPARLHACTQPVTHSTLYTLTLLRASRAHIKLVNGLC